MLILVVKSISSVNMSRNASLSSPDLSIAHLNMRLNNKRYSVSVCYRFGIVVCLFVAVLRLFVVMLRLFVAKLRLFFVMLRLFWVR
jgi:hypothetical protein